MREFHPVANILPLLGDAALQDLAADIKAHGLQQPLVLHEGKILDGRNRARACELAGVTPGERVWAGECGTPACFVLSMNVQRRHLTVSQIAMAAASGAAFDEAAAAALGRKRSGGAESKRPAASAPDKSAPRGALLSGTQQPAKPKQKKHRATEDVAQAAGIGSRTVDRAKRVQDKAPDLAEQVTHGTLTLGAAEHALRTAEKAATVAVQVAGAPVADVQLDVADATEPWPVAPGSVDLIFTSPPYGLDKPYHGMTDAAAAWPTFMQDWLRQAFVAAADTGRLALNVPLDTAKDAYRPTWPEACAAALAAGWAYRTCLVWAKGNSTKGNRGLGSENSADAPHPIAEVEMIGLFYKGAWKKHPPRPSDICPADWQAWGDGVWSLPGETRPWEGHPAPFSEELARRVLLYFSRVGDVVLDPFAGSGTTVLVARRLKRIPIGLDQSAAYIASAQRRLTRDQEPSDDQTSAQEQLSFDVLAGASA